MRKRILILAKSNKKRHNQSYGKCVAGISLEPADNYRWFRLVADDEGDSLLDSQFSYNTLDVVDVELYPCPRNNQVENCRFSVYGKVGSKTIQELQSIFEKMPHSFFGDMKEFAVNPKNSLTIFFAKNLHIYWAERAGKKYQKVDFNMDNKPTSSISMTDPKHYTNKEKNGVADIPAAICVASLPSEPKYMDRYPKIIATIFPVNPKQIYYSKNSIPNIPTNSNALGYDFSNIPF